MYQNLSASIKIYKNNDNSQRKFHGGNSELWPFTFPQARRSLCPVGTNSQDH